MDPSHVDALACLLATTRSRRQTLHLLLGWCSVGCLAWPGCAELEGKPAVASPAANRANSATRPAVHASSHVAATNSAMRGKVKEYRPGDPTTLTKSDANGHIETRAQTVHEVSPAYG
jgi:hypothetical protein